MLTPRQNFLETLRRDGKPDRLASGFTPFKAIGGDPVFQYTRGNRIRGTDSYDRWGTFISFREDQPAAVPIVTPENQVIQDIEEWQKYVKVPDLRANCETGWETALANKEAIDKEQYLSMTIMGTGIFEQLHMLMTFEDSLMNLLLYPDEMHELIDAVCEYRLEYMKLIVEHLHPDAILSHDDFGSKTSLFFKPETWREFFKEPYRKLYTYLHENDVLVLHHSDSYCAPIVEDMAEIGIDVFQGALSSNNIPALTAQLDGRMAIMGGIESEIDREDVTEDEIRTEVRRCLKENGHLKHFIPSITYGGPGTLFPQVEQIVLDEIEHYNQENFGVSMKF